jgi:hypothetical protein
MQNGRIVLAVAMIGIAFAAVTTGLIAAESPSQEAAGYGRGYAGHFDAENQCRII